MIKAIIFDLDNTLVDFMRLKRASCEEAMEAMIDAGLEIKKDNALKLLFELYEKYGIEDKEIFQKFLMKTIGKIDWKILASGIVAYRKVKTGYLSPYPGVIPTLIKLKQHGITLAILSDAPRLRAWMRLASMDLSDFFDVVVTFDDTNKTKPHPAPFKKVLSKLKFAPEEVLMVGDWPERDMKGAKKAGMKTCFARYGAVKKYKGVNADYEVSNVKQILDIVKKENE